MVDSSLLVSSLFPTSSSSSSDTTLAIFGREDSTLATITSDLLNTKYNIEQSASTVSISENFRQFITDNIGEDRAAQLLADIDAIDNFNNEQENRVDNPVGQLIGSDSATKQTNILDLLA